MPKYVYQFDFLTRAVLRFYVWRFLRETLQYSAYQLEMYMSGKVSDLYFLQEVKAFCDRREARQ